MARSLPSLNALRAFDAAARLQSFRDAADELHVTPAAVSYQIAALEDYLGVELFRRDGRLMYLTEAGAIIAPGVANGFAEFTTAMEKLDSVMRSKVGRHEKREVLTIDVAPAFASKWLLPRLHRFTAQLPDVDVRIQARRELTNFHDGMTDVAIRFGRGQYSDLQVEKLLDEAVTPVCSPRLFSVPADAPRSPSDLNGKVLLHDDSYYFTDSRPNWATWLKAAKVEGIDALAGPRFDLSELALQASIEACGVALGRVTLSRADIESGRLVCPFDLVLPLDLGYYLVGLPQAFKAPKVEKLRQWLMDEVKDCFQRSEAAAQMPSVPRPKRVRGRSAPGLR